MTERGPRGPERDVEVWERAAHIDYAVFEATLADRFPEIVDQFHAVVPEPKRIMCPLGHRILDVSVTVDSNWHPSLAPARSRRGASAAAEPATPRARDAFAQVCAQARCPNLTPCPAHPDANVVDRVDGGRVRFTCPHRTCRYRGVYTQVKLLQLYGLAVRYRRREIHLRV